MADQTALDFVSLRDRMIESGKSRFPDIDWDSPLVVERWMIEQFAFVGERIGFYNTNNARESRWGTAAQRRSQIALAKLIAEPLIGARAARAEVTFSITGTTAGDVIFPAGTTMPRTEEVTDPIRFQLLADVTIPAGQTSASGTVEHSEPHDDGFTSTDRPNQEFILSQTPYLEDRSEDDVSTVVTAANGTYTRVDTFLDSTASDRHFTVTVDNLDRATLRFGNGTSGAIPAGDITVTYRTGGGAAGNVPAGAIKVLEGQWTDSLGNPVVVTVTNAAAAEGGDDRESVAQARERIPRAARTREVAVAREDYEDAALEVAGVARALALTYAEDTTVDQNTVIIYPVPTAGGVPNDTLKTLVRAQFLQVSGYPAPPYRAFQNLDLRVQTPLYTTINVRTKVYFRAGVTGSVGKARITAALTDYFSPTITAARLIELAPLVARARGVTSADGTAVLNNPLVNFGYYLQDVDGEPIGSYPLDDIRNLIHDVPGVARVAGDSEGLLLNDVAQDVALEAWGFPVLGTVTVVDAKTGLVL